jgi:hypothetical protein
MRGTYLDRLGIRTLGHEALFSRRKNPVSSVDGEPAGDRLPGRNSRGRHERAEGDRSLDGGEHRAGLVGLRVQRVSIACPARRPPPGERPTRSELLPESPGGGSFREGTDPNPPTRSSPTRPGGPTPPTPARDEPLRGGCPFSSAEAETYVPLRSPRYAWHEGADRGTALICPSTSVPGWPPGLAAGPQRRSAPSLDSPFGQ